MDGSTPQSWSNLPPVVPGHPQPATEPPAPQQPPTPPPAPKRRIGILIAVAAAVVVVGTATAAAVVAFTGDDAAEANPFTVALDKCGIASHTSVEVADGGNTMIVDGLGEEDSTGLDTGALKCLLDALDTPTSVTQHMAKTRALDGQQEDEWGRFEARWTYHPDQGLDVTVTVKSGN